MQETTGDIFDYLTDADTDAICIFTNGIVNNHGYAMAGAGQAGVANSKWTNFRWTLGQHIVKNGNVVGLLGTNDEIENILRPGAGIFVISFPTKNHFNKPSSPELIVKSARELVKLSNEHRFKKVVMGRPGCGVFTGRLNYEKDIKPLLIDILDNRFIIVNKVK